MSDDDAGGGEETKSRQITWNQVIVGLGVIIGAFMLFGVLTDDDDEEPVRLGGTAVDVPSSTVEINYYVMGTADGADLTLETPSGTEQATGKAVPLATPEGKRGITMQFARGDFVYISAQNTRRQRLDLVPDRWERRHGHLRGQVRWCVRDCHLRRAGSLNPGRDESPRSEPGATSYCPQMWTLLLGMPPWRNNTGGRP